VYLYYVFRALDHSLSKPRADAYNVKRCIAASRRTTSGLQASCQNVEGLCLQVNLSC
jgi:hypothetical protein